MPRVLASSIPMPVAMWVSTAAASHPYFEYASPFVLTTLPRFRISNIVIQSDARV
jgi:hypothetical protein